MSDAEAKVSEIIEMAWCDKTSFDDVYAVMGVSESEVIRIMRTNLKPSSYRLWRKRVSGRKSKHRRTLNS
ncbi:MAG: TIGR03643 family protein [Alphaproteobacteria bacterium]